MLTYGKESVNSLCRIVGKAEFARAQRLEIPRHVRLGDRSQRGRLPPGPAILVPQQGAHAFAEIMSHYDAAAHAIFHFETFVPRQPLSLPHQLESELERGGRAA